MALQHALQALAGSSEHMLLWHAGKMLPDSSACGANNARGTAHGMPRNTVLLSLSGWLQVNC